MSPSFSNKSLTFRRCLLKVLCGISSRFQLLSQFKGQVTHALLTRPPLSFKSFTPKGSILKTPFDLHVLGMPPAFVLSQDQTLHEMFFMNVQCLLIHSIASYLLALFFLSEKTELMFCPHEFRDAYKSFGFVRFNCLIFKEPPSRDSYIRISSFFFLVNTFFQLF